MEAGEGVGAKPKMPQILKELGKQAIGRLEKRSATPEISISGTEDGWTFASPYHDGDVDEWEALLFEPFATRSIAVFNVFTSELAALSPKSWRRECHGWIPNEIDLRAAIQIVRSVRPRNEAEACLAAQMVAVRRMQMKLSAQALSQSWPEPRTCAIAGKLARTYAMQLETQGKLRGKGTRQRITVRKHSQHEHKHIHVHQGGIENGNQPYEPSGSQAAQIEASSAPSKRSPLPCSNSAEHPLHVPRHEGEEPVPLARRGERIRSAER